MLEIQKFLMANSIADLDQFAIRAIRHKKYPNLVLFKYSQVDSPMKEPIVQECRGIILDESDDWKIVSRGFNKFFNHGEHLAAPIDWESAVVQEKLDGSFCCLFYYTNEWHVQTSGTPDASGQVGDTEFTFAELFWKVFEEKQYGLPIGLEDRCFVFELMTKHNKVIVRHEENDLKLIGVRFVTGPEINIYDFLLINDPCKDFLNWEPVKIFRLQDIKEMEDSFPAMDPFKQEGYVVVDKDFNRVKVKNPKYVAIHHLKEGNSLARLVALVQNGEYGEFVSYFPEWFDDIQNIEAELIGLINDLSWKYEEIKHIESQKEFALEAVKTKCSSALFCVRSGRNPSIRDYINKMAPDKVIDMLGLKYCEGSNKNSTIQE